MLGRVRGVFFLTASPGMEPALRNHGQGDWAFSNQVFSVAPYPR